MEENPTYYAVIPADVRYDKRLKANEKLMFGEITCLSQKEGYCYASNSYFAELYDVTPQAISGWIKNLEKCGYITCEYLHNGTEVKERRIRMTNSIKDEKGNSTKLEKGINKTLKGYKQKFKENTTRMNNTSDNITSCYGKTTTKQKRFIKPTVLEISSYCSERKNNIDAQYFYDYYESKGWLVGKSGMKDWKACIRTWERKQKDYSKPQRSDWSGQATDEEYRAGASNLDTIGF